MTISCDFAKVSTLQVAEEVDGQRAYYSLSGAAGSWTLIPSLTTATSGRVTATLNLSWPSAASLYILWADDNGSGTPDTPFQIDNFSAIATPFRSTVRGRSYFANCAWDMLGIPAALHCDALIEAVFTESNDAQAVQVEIRDGKVSNSKLLVHFPLPFARWYDDLVFT